VISVELDRNFGDDRADDRNGGSGTFSGALDGVCRLAGATMNETKLTAAPSVAVPGNAGYLTRTSGGVGGRRA